LGPIADLDEAEGAEIICPSCDSNPIPSRRWFSRYNFYVMLQSN